MLTLEIEQLKRYLKKSPSDSRTTSSSTRILQVYLNRHRLRQNKPDVFSVREKGGKVLYHSGAIFLEDAKFIVQEGGRQRVLRTGIKNVHAWVEGKEVQGSVMQEWWENTVRVHYNPLLHDCFFRDTFQDDIFYTPVYEAKIVGLAGGGIWISKP